MTPEKALQKIIECTDIAGADKNTLTNSRRKILDIVEEFRVPKKARVGYLAVYTGTHGGILKTDVDIAAVELAPVEPLLRDGIAISEHKLESLGIPPISIPRVIAACKQKADSLVDWDE